LLLVLAGGCAFALRHGGEDPPEPKVPVSSDPPTSAAPATTASGVRWFGVDVGVRSGCQQLTAVEPQLSCPIPNGTVVYTEVVDAAARYDGVAGPIAGGTATGAPACAAGHAEERAWSRPSSPTAVAGRYSCRVAAGRADLWWSVDDAGLVAHATRADGDLASLFTWWRVHSEPPSPAPNTRREHP